MPRECKHDLELALEADVYRCRCGAFKVFYIWHGRGYAFAQGMRRKCRCEQPALKLVGLDQQQEQP